MIRTLNRKNGFKALALLIFTAFLVNLAFSRPLTAFAGNEPGLNIQNAAAIRPPAAQPGTIRTPLAPATAFSPLVTTHVYLPLLVKSGPVVTPTATPPPTPPPPGAEGALFLNTTKKTDSASAAVDAAGGFHLAYAAFVAFADGNPAYYAYCSANCGTASGWGILSLSDRVEEVQLALTSAGHPRLLMRVKDANYDDQYQYAACDVNCTSLAGWTITTVASSTYSLLYLSSYAGHHYFALDQQDRPRFLYRKTIALAYYVYCDAGCANPASWWQYPLNEAIFSDPTNLPTLTFTSASQPRITAMIMGGPDAKDWLTYIACDTNCNDLANWTYAALMERGSGHVSSALRFTASGQPRLVFNQGSINSGPAGYLWYWWCSTACGNGANWSGTNVGAPGQVEDPDLALDAVDRPRIAFKDNSPDGLGYIWCNTGCETNSAAWYGGLVEASSDLDDTWPILPPTGCSSSYWYGGFRPSLALDPAGNPRMGYVAQHLHGGGCTVKEDYRAVRFIFFDQP